MEISSPEIAPASGLLRKRISMDNFDLIRIVPSDALKPFVENYWIIIWDRVGKPDYTQENLPHPSINLVIDPFGKTGVFGVQTGKFCYEISGSGRLFGVKFWPGAFFGFLDRSVSELRATHLPISDIFGDNDQELERKFLTYNDPASMGGDIEKMLLARNPKLDAKALEARRLVQLIAANTDIISIGELAKTSGVSARSIQRLFETYVGVGPKWVIDRYRMLAAVDALNRGAPVRLTELAHRLGYFDQAHFSSVFRALTGATPSSYRQSGEDQGQDAKP